MKLKEKSSGTKKKYQISDALYRKIIDHYIFEDGWPTEHEAIDYYHDLPAMLDISCEEFKAKAICNIKQFVRAVQRYWQEQKQLGNDLPWEERYKTPPDMIVDREILTKEIEKWGVVHQLNQTKEKCAELIIAVSKFLQGENDENNDQAIEVIEKAAEVKIMIAQMEIIFGHEKIQSQVIQKANQLKGQISEASVFL